MAKLSRMQNSDLSGGAQTKTTDRLALSNQLKHVLNGEFSSRLGAVTGRRGSLVLSTVLASQEVLTILQYIKNDGTAKYFASVDDGEATPKVDLYVNAGVLSGAWSKAVEDLTTAVDIFGVNVINKLIICNGVDTVVGWNGTAWGAITNAPVAGKFPEVYKQRLFMLDEKGFLHYSDVVNSTGDDFTTTTWTNRGINPNDGQKSTMLKRHRGRLIIFKQESIYRYDGTNEPEAEITVGTHSGKSVVILNEIFFHHPTGIYKMNVGDPVLISRPMQKYIDGMSASNWSKVSAGRDLENVYYWLGDVTIEDPLEHDYNVTYSNVVLVYNVYAQNWTAFSGWDARTWFYDKTSGLSYFGTSAGKIVKINTAYADVDGSTTTPIRFETIFMPKDYGYPKRLKEFNRIEVIGEFRSDVLKGGNYEEMIAQGRLNSPVRAGKVTAKKLWLGVNEEYSDIPPRIEEVILDDVNLLDNAS